MNDEFDLRKLILQEEEVHSPAVHNISVFEYRVVFNHPQDDINQIINNAERVLKNNFYFKPPKRKRMRQGFIEVKNEEGLLKCVYAKESPIKLVYVTDELELLENRYKLVNANNVKATVNIYHDGARIVLIGGSDPLIGKTVKEIQYALGVRDGFKEVRTTLTQESLRAILANIENVRYLWIEPGDSDKFIQIIKKMGKDEINYKVFAKFQGTRVTMAPVVSEILNEERGIRIKEIQGTLNLRGYKITTKIYSKGKLFFTIPDDIVPKTGSPNDIAEDYYKKVIGSFK